MTVAIAPITAKPPASGSSADSAATADTALDGTDFASLLLGQLAAANLQPDMVDQLPPVATTELLDGATDPQNAALLLAALGMAPPQPDGKVATVEVDTDPLPVGNDKKASAIPPLAGTSATPSAAQLAATPGADRGIGNGASVAPAPDDRAAKFAVVDFAPAKADAPAIKSLPVDAAGTTPTPVAALAPQQSSNATAVANAPLRVDTPVRDPAWSGDFSQKVVWLTANDQKFAQLSLNPPQMGPIEISLNINKDTASAYFISPNAEVREAIETALPRLREMLAGVGIELGQANVSAQSSRHETGNPEARQGAPRWLADEDILGGDSRRHQAAIAQRGNGLVDTFA